MSRIYFTLVLIPLLLTACGRQVVATQAPVSTSTPDPCSAENLPAEVIKVNNLMREFDDYSSLASNTPQEQLVKVIPELQRIQRAAEDLAVPACLQTLKQLELAHMNTVVQTLLAFLGSADLQMVNDGIAQARELHNQYDIEMARLLGITLIPPTATTATSPVVP
jgi:hypothetical protein